MRRLIDPRVQARGLCGLLFVGAAIAKVLAPAGFLETLSHMQWIPEPMRPFVAIAVPGFELVLGAILLAGWHRKLFSRIAFALLVLFTAVLLTLPKGVDCGCFGEASGILAWFSTGAGAIVRNCVLLALTGWLGFFPERSRRLREEVSLNA